MALGETFDLGRVMQTAEAIKGMRRQEGEDAIRRQYLQGQLGLQQQTGQIAQAQEQRAATQFSQDQQLTNTRMLNAAAAEVAQNPAAVSRWLPQLQQAGVLDPSFDPAQIRPEQLQQAAQKLYQSTSAALQAINPPEQSNEPLQAIVGPDGKPVLAPRSQAVGAQPYYQPKSGLKVKSDGQGGFELIQGELAGGDIGAADLTAPTRNKLQESIIGATDEMERLNSIGEAFDPSYLQLEGKAKALGIKIKDFAGGYLGNLSPEEQQYLSGYSTFTAEAAKNLSAILNRLSGAAISPAEAERLKKGIPHDGDSPTQFQAKYKASVKDASRAIMRANWALTNGIGVKSVDQLSKIMPLTAIDREYEKRANAIWKELGSTPDTKQEAIKRAKQEFGVGR